jgi:hypothetical protein
MAPVSPWKREVESEESSDKSDAHARQSAPNKVAGQTGPAGFWIDPKAITQKDQWSDSEAQQLSDASKISSHSGSASELTSSDVIRTTQYRAVVTEENNHLPVPALPMITIVQTTPGVDPQTSAPPKMPEMPSIPVGDLVPQRMPSAPPAMPDSQSVKAQQTDQPEPSNMDSVPQILAPFYQTPTDAPLGYTGPSRVLSRDVQQDNHFVPVEDRWRIGFPEWDRYDKGHPAVNDYPYVPGSKWDPYNQNVLKGDYPILGQNIFLEITGTTLAFFEPRQVPTATTPFESTANPNSKDFFGNPNQFFYSQFFFLSFDFFQGDASFRPVDWRVKITPAFNVNYLSVNELAVVGPNVTDGTVRGRTFATLQEWFGEVKLTDIGPNFDFLSLRAGSQPFTSDFRGFIFSDINQAVRLFGTNFSNRDQFNLVYFHLLEKDTDSLLNSFHNRHQQVIIANYYRQDFIFPGYTAQWSVHYNHDSPTMKFDTNGFLVRPDPVGVFQPHTVDVAYLGWTGDGHIEHLNINHAFYWALGHDSLNPLANQPQLINGQMAALELSYDQDWIRFRTSFFWSSGDRDIRNRRATGFDSIDDNPNFAGGEFSYWQRQQIKLFGVDLNQRMSLVPDLRSRTWKSHLR